MGRDHIRGFGPVSPLYIYYGPLLWSYLKIIRFFYRHFDYKISLFVCLFFFFFHSDFTINTNFGVMNSERMPAKICKFVETFLPVDLYSSPT